MLNNLETIENRLCEKTLRNIWSCARVADLIDLRRMPGDSQTDKRNYYYKKEKVGSSR